MNSAPTNALADVLSKRDREIMTHWLELQSKSSRRGSAAEKNEAVRESNEFMAALKAAAQTEQTDDIGRPGWAPMRDLLNGISSRRAKGGYTPTETASFIFSLKEPVFGAAQSELGDNPKALLAAIWQITELIDKLGLFTMESFQKTREEVIARQQQELMELSTPVVPNDELPQQRHWR